MRSYFILITLLISILFSTCRKNEESPHFPEVITDTTALIGSWRRHYPDNSVFEVLFHSNDTYEFTHFEPNGQPLILENGEYSNTEYSYTLMRSNNTSCLGYNAIYTYTIIGDKITFFPQYEYCDKRSSFLIGEWKKSD